MPRRLTVFLFSKKVGALQQENGQLRFAYDSAWLARPEARPISHSLPLRDEPFDDLAARPFFAGLLPEGDLRVRLAKILRVSRLNDFAPLDALGGECAGAITLLEDDIEIMPPSAPSSPLWLDDGELANLLMTLPNRPMLVGESGPRLSLAGAQDKLPVLAEEADGRIRIALPPREAPSSHILKLETADLPGGVHNEAFCLTLAATCGLPAASATIRQIPSSNLFFLLVERYDRRQSSDGRWERLSQEDFCQAMGVVPEYKYQNEGGPDLAACFELLRSATRPSALEILRLLDGVIFNALVGNNDAHAKNFSLIYEKRYPTLAPLYDVLCSAIYPCLNEKMAMKIGSKYHFDDLFPRHWEAFAKSAGLSSAQVKKRVSRMAALIPGQAHKTLNDFIALGLTHGILTDIVNLIQDRCSLSIKRLTK
ncbi:MAG: type II toxin-antitoxin system HipA family toxin [Deltaproteobacteria bacterium]|jgi:serine/threonine-protein kinase HipA|nr:type II toxin-antitoxin system HipA family toxin [Deltaproteobacteria bacterium]